MSSFATDVVVAQKSMCSRDAIKQAVDTLDKALHDPETPRSETSKDPANAQMQLGLAQASQAQKKQVQSS